MTLKDYVILSKFMRNTFELKTIKEYCLVEIKTALYSYYSNIRVKECSLFCLNLKASSNFVL